MVLSIIATAIWVWHTATAAASVTASVTAAVATTPYVATAAAVVHAGGTAALATAAGVAAEGAAIGICVGAAEEAKKRRENKVLDTENKDLKYKNKVLTRRLAEGERLLAYTDNYYADLQADA